jgi:hypothetical protein
MMIKVDYLLKFVQFSIKFAEFLFIKFQLFLFTNLISLFNFKNFFIFLLFTTVFTIDLLLIINFLIIIFVLKFSIYLYQ